MASKRQITELELAAAVVDWLKAQHWEVYQEVAYHEEVADIVAVQDPICWAIECKVTQSLDVLAQADRWVGHAHLVSIAVKKPKVRRRTDRLVYQILRDHGIGRITYGTTRDGSPIINQDYAPTLHRIRNIFSIREALAEEQKNFAPAGNQNGHHWSPFQRTASYVQDIVEDDPGICFKDMLSRLDHHYASDASAKVSLRHWLGKGVIKGVRLERDGRYLRLYPAKRGELVE